jgi:hypothetical protein
VPVPNLLRFPTLHNSDGQKTRLRLDHDDVCDRTYGVDSGSFVDYEEWSRVEGEICLCEDCAGRTGGKWRWTVGKDGINTVMLAEDGVVIEEAETVGVLSSQETNGILSRIDG